MMSKKTYFTSLKDHIHRIPEHPVFFKDRVSVSTAPHRNRNASPETINSGTQPRSTKQTLGATSPEMSCYHGDSSRKYTYLKRAKEEIPMLSPKEAVSVFFDKTQTTENTL